MIVSGSCHYAKNRSPFTSYRRLNGGCTIGGTRCIGVGTVELNVKRSNTPGDGDENTYTLVLENVFHTPDTLSNGFNPLRTECDHAWGEGVVKGTDRRSGEALWYAEEFAGLMRLVIAGNPQGESVLEREVGGGRALSLSIYIMPEELANINAQLAEGAGSE
jgi:hypothetical protein